MNALRIKKTTALTMAGATTLLGGCLEARFASDEAQSPLAPRIEALVEANRGFPRWREFPAAPADLPDPARIAANVRTLEGDAGALAGEVARIDWTLGDPAALAAEARAQTDAVPVSPDAARSAAEIDAFAETLRARAKAPPPVDRQPTP